MLCRQMLQVLGKAAPAVSIVYTLQHPDTIKPYCYTMPTSNLAQEGDDKVFRVKQLPY